MSRRRPMSDAMRRGLLTEDEALWLHEVLVRARRADDLGVELAAAHMLDSYTRCERVTFSDFGRYIVFDTANPIGCC